MNRKQQRAGEGDMRATKAAARTDEARDVQSAAQEQNELACRLLTQGRLSEAATHFARALTLMPELLEQYAQVVTTLLNVSPAVREGIARVGKAWPRELAAEELLGTQGIAAISDDPLLRCLLESSTVRDLNLERYLTSLRRIVLGLALTAAEDNSSPCTDSVLNFCCALAKQCFINEYVFAASPGELAEADELKARLVAALDSGRTVAPIIVAAVAAYFPLWELAQGQPLLDRPWPPAVQSLLAKQVSEPTEERQLRGSIPRLTGISDAVSLLVRQQYEENPYPRWVAPPSDRGGNSVTDYLRRQFPAAVLNDVPHDKRPEILVAGCGTGQQAIMTARRFATGKVLALDLSLASLAYAKRMARALAAINIEFAQADLIELKSIGRTFDLIETSGVLHHLAEPMTGWRVLFSLLRSGGVMHVGFYSAAARQDVAAARAFVAEQGWQATAEGIRRCRREILNTPMKTVARYADFFSVSECRDLLFHVQEHQLSIPEIKSFLREHNLQFIGFELHPRTLETYRFRFPADRSMTDLNLWQQFETENPTAFAGMYQFWVQRG
jgi:trans-aconitate methyltransferase